VAEVGGRPGPAWSAIAERIHRSGPLPFHQYQHGCLYGPGGFYARGGGAGRRADFLTSPSVGPLFGAVVARVIDAEWDRCRRPDPWVVVEAGAGDGALAAAVLATGGALACRGALRYVCVEASASLREAAGARLSVEEPALVLGPRPPAADPGAGTASPVPRQGPLVALLADLPAEPFTGMILANELLDNLVVDLFARQGGHWAEVRIGEARRSPVEVLVPAAAADAALIDRLLLQGTGEASSGPTDGARVPLQHVAYRWLASALGLVQRGRVIGIDYCSTTAALAARPQSEWLRTYRGHGRGGDPLARPGDQDITCEVAVDQMARVRPSTADRSQAEWLAANGIEGLADAARAAWQAAAHRPDLAALSARSRLSEAAALTDEDGLGAFRVLEWAVG
jgi:SAM-dependent MidA family methyltransferase